MPQAATFALGSTGYTITRILIGSASLGSTAGALSFGLAGTGGLPAADIANLELHAGASSFAFSTAGYVGQGGANLYAWSDSGLSWSVDDTVTLRLRRTAGADMPTNNAPVFAATTETRTVPENSTAGTNVGDPVTATDDDSGDTLEYSLEGTDATSFAVDSASGQITTIANVDYNHEATKNSYSVTVKASDGTDSATIAVTINVTDVSGERPSAPAAPAVSAASVSSLNVNWSAPTNAGPAITDYDVQYRTASPPVSWTEIKNTPITGLSTTIESLAENTSYDVQVRATNDEGTGGWSPSGTGSTDANAAPTGRPVIGGPVLVGQELRASTDGIADADGLTRVTFVYQWFTSDGTTDTEIAGASSTAYTIVLADVGRAIKVRVTFSDDTGNDEVLWSEATAAVADFTPEVDGQTVAEASVTISHEASGGDYESTAVEPVEVRVVENDAPTLSVGETSAVESAGAVVFEVTLTTAGSEAVTVDYATSDGTAAAGADYTSTAGTLRYEAGTTGSREITVPVIDDGEDEEESETFTLTLRNVQGASLAGGESTVDVRGTIQDDDIPAVVVSFGSARYDVTEGAGVEVSVRLNADPERPVDIPLLVTHGNGATDQDYAGVPASVAFGAGATSQTFTFSAEDDLDAESVEMVVIRFGAVLPERVSGRGETTLTIRDNDGGNPPPSPPSPPPPPPPDPAPPAARFELSAECVDDLCMVGTGVHVKFRDLSSGTVEARRWDFGDGAGSPSSAPRHSWSTPGFYRVELVVSGLGTESRASRDPEGCRQ